MNLVTIENHTDIVGHHHIRTERGIIFLNSLIKNHPLSVIDFLKEGGYDALISLVLEREKALLSILAEDPNDLDGAREALYGEFKYDSELDKEIEALEEEIYQLEAEKNNLMTLPWEEYVEDINLDMISVERAIEISEERERLQIRELEKKKLLAQDNLEDKQNLKNSLSPIQLDFFPHAGDIIQSIPMDDVYFS